MMNYWLLAVLIIELIVNLAIDKDILRPSVLFNMGFVYATFILAVNTSTWQYQISFTTFSVICMSPFLMFIGEQFGKRLNLKFRRIVIGEYHLKAKYCTKKTENFYFVMGLILSVLLIVVRLRSIRSSFATYGQGEYLLSNYRAYGISENSSNFGLKLLEIASYGFTYYFFNRYCYYKALYQKSQPKYLLMLGLCMLSCVLSSARSTMMHVVFCCTLIWLLTNRQVHKEISISSKAKRRIVYILVFGLCAFAVLGNLTGKTQIGGFFETISVYSAGGIPALDTFIQNFDGNSTFGYYTLSGLTRILELIGVNVTYNVSYFSHGAFITIGGFTTNIYTCFRNYLSDYGYVGTQVLMLLMGIIFGIFYRQVTNKEELKPVNYTVYSFLIFYVFFSFITERVFSQILTATTIFEILLLLFLYARMPFEMEYTI